VNHAPWPPEDEARLKELLADPQRTYQEIARALNRSFDSIAHKAKAMGLARSSRIPWSDTEARHAATLSWPQFHERYPSRTWAGWHNKRSRVVDEIRVRDLALTDYTARIERLEGDAVVCSCVHVPETDPVMWQRLLAIGQRDGIRQLVVAGDIVTGDMFSKWVAGGQIPEWEWDKELESLRLHLRQALAVFDVVVILPGNHVTNRISRITNGHVRLHHLIRMAGLADEEWRRIVTTDLDFIKLTSGDQTFLIGHATNYSTIDGRVAAWYAEKEETHVIVGHGHRTGHQVARSGKWHGWEVGTLADPRYMAYVQKALNKFPKMLQTFLTVRNGAVREYGAGLPMTDWGAELG